MGPCPSPGCGGGPLYGADPMCPSTMIYQVQHLVAFVVGLIGKVLGTVSTGVNQILTDLGALFLTYSENCTVMASLTTGIFGDNMGLIYWINMKILWLLGQLFP